MLGIVTFPLMNTNSQEAWLFQFQFELVKVPLSKFTNKHTDSHQKQSIISIWWEPKLGCVPSRPQVVYLSGFLKQLCGSKQRMETKKLLRDLWKIPYFGLKLEVGSSLPLPFCYLLFWSIQISFQWTQTKIVAWWVRVKTPTLAGMDKSWTISTVILALNTHHQMPIAGVETMILRPSYLTICVVHAVVAALALAKPVIYLEKTTLMVL